MHGCAGGLPPEGRWGGRSNPPLQPSKLGYQNNNNIQKLVNNISKKIGLISLLLSLFHVSGRVRRMK